MFCATITPRHAAGRDTTLQAWQFGTETVSHVLQIIGARKRILRSWRLEEEVAPEDGISRSLSAQLRRLRAHVFDMWRAIQEKENRAKKVVAWWSQTESNRRPLQCH